jgi:aryl-phospho-beta-D-glucosidase BglC (GH1 family)
VLSSVRSESLKGLVTRVGTRIVKGVSFYTTELGQGTCANNAPQNVKLRLSSLPPPRGSPTYDLAISSAPQAPTLVIQQLTSLRNSINNCLDVIDVTAWAGNAKDANYVAGQMQLLHDNILEARQALKDSSTTLQWWESPVDEKVSTLESDAQTRR